MRFYAIFSDNGKSFPTVYPPRDRNASRVSPCPLCGNKVVENVLYDEIEVTGGRKWPDILWGPSPLVVSRNVLDVWSGSSLTGYAPIPLQFRYGGKRRPVDDPPQYSQLLIKPWGIRPKAEQTIVVRQDVERIFDPRPASAFAELCPACLNDRNGLFVSMYSVKQAVFDESSWNGCDLVRLGSDVYASEKLVAISLAAGFTNLRCVNAHEVGDTSAASLTKVP